VDFITRTFLNKKDPPTCSGCGKKKDRPFWGECKLYNCAASKVEHRSVCKESPCEIFVKKFDPSAGQNSSYTRTSLLACRKKRKPRNPSNSTKNTPQHLNKKTPTSSTLKHTRFKKNSTYKNANRPCKTRQTEPHKNPLTTLCTKKPRGGGGSEKTNKTQQTAFNDVN
jgi:hypothetical protein